VDDSQAWTRNWCSPFIRFTSTASGQKYSRRAYLLCKFLSVLIAVLKRTLDSSPNLWGKDMLITQETPTPRVQTAWNFCKLFFIEFCLLSMKYVSTTSRADFSLSRCSFVLSSTPEVDRTNPSTLVTVSCLRWMLHAGSYAQCRPLPDMLRVGRSIRSYLQLPPQLSRLVSAMCPLIPDVTEYTLARSFSNRFQTFRVTWIILAHVFSDF